MVMKRTLWFGLVVAICVVGVSADDTAGARPGIGGTVPTDMTGRPLNLDFEKGTLADWRAEGSAFERQPVEGDTINRRRGDMHSRHAGRFWVGTYERNGDPGRGTLTSVPFRVSKLPARE